MDYQTAAAILFACGGFLIAAVDVFLLVAHGKEATITAAIRLMAHEHPVIPLLVGILLGHLFAA